MVFWKSYKLCFWLAHSSPRPYLMLSKEGENSLGKLEKITAIYLVVLRQKVPPNESLLDWGVLS